MPSKVMRWDGLKSKDNTSEVQNRDRPMNNDGNGDSQLINPILQEIQEIQEMLETKSKPIS